MKLKLFSVLAGILLLATSAHASIIYKFDFTGLTGVTGGTGGDFSITLTYSDYVTTTGMAPAPGAPFATSLGYPVAYAGTNNSGQWGFDDDTSSSISDSGFSFGGESFLFLPSPGHPGYFTAPGIFAGSVLGNAPFAFSGSATLTIIDTSVIPEPATLALLGLGLAGLGFARRKR
jgi:hypothetical protein